MAVRKTAKKPEKKTGRKGKYEYWISTDGLLLIEGWARDGLTKEQIAKNIGISRDTLNEWEKKFSDISDALKKGREVADRIVENALFKNATGYDTEETTEEPWFNKTTGKNELVVTKRVKKHVPGNVTAQIFWLKNRKPNDWRDKHDIEVENTNDETVKEMEAYFAKLGSNKKTGP